MNAQDRRRKRRAEARRQALAAAAGLALEAPPELVVSPEQAALDAVRAFAESAASDDEMGACATDGCGHAYDAHAGAAAAGAGACTMADCGCTSYTPPTAAADLSTVTFDDGHGMAVTLRFNPALSGVTNCSEPNSAAVVTSMKARLENFVLTFDDANVVALPPEHEPGATLPAANPTADIPLPEPKSGADSGTLHWVADIVPEGVLTDDRRAMAPGSLTWRELPLSLMAMVETSEGGHIGAEVSGRIDKIWREGNMLKASGIFDGGDYGLEIARMVGEGVLRGISVDIAVSNYEFGPKDAWFDEDGNWAPKPEEEVGGGDLLDALFPDESDAIFVVTEGVIGAVTVCPFPAFADAKIMLAAALMAGAAPMHWVVQQDGHFLTSVDGARSTRHSSRGPIAVTASAAGLAPVNPPAEWFEDPALEELTGITVTPEGRIYGHAWEWDTCHLAFPESCVTAPHSSSSYRYFHLKEVECDDGSVVQVGTVTLEAPHAPQYKGYTAKQAMEHYDHTGWAAADIVVGEDVFGGWVAGAIRPDMDSERVRDLRGSVLSGDWRQIDGNLELIGLLGVNIPGFPVPRVRALVASGEGGKQEVVVLTAAGIHVGDGSTLDDETREKFAVLAARAAQEAQAA